MGRRRRAIAPSAPPAGAIEVEVVSGYSSRFGSRAAGDRFFYDLDADPHRLKAQGLVRPYAAKPAAEQAQG